MKHLRKTFLAVIFLLSSSSFSIADSVSYSWSTQTYINGIHSSCWEDMTYHGQWVSIDNHYYNYCDVNYGPYVSGSVASYVSTFYGIGIQPLTSSNLCEKSLFTSIPCESEGCSPGYVRLNFTHEAYDLAYNLDIKQISGQTWQFYLKTKRVNGWVDPNMTGFYGYTLTNTVFEDRNITGTVAAYIQKEDGSWMFLKNLQYLFSPGEEGIDFKCNSYKFEYVLDETPCGPQTYTLIKNKEKLFNARLDQPTFYQPVNFVPQSITTLYYYAVNGTFPYYDFLNLYRLSDNYGWNVDTATIEIESTVPLDTAGPFVAWGYNALDQWWSNSVPATLSLSRTVVPPITWNCFYLSDNWQDWVGCWGPDDDYPDKMLSDTYLGPFLVGFVGYGSDYDWTFEPLTVNALDEIVCSPTVTQSYYYNKASCAYTEVAPVFESDGTHSFYPGEMCAGTGVEVWYQTCSGAVKYLYLEGVYETNCFPKGSYFNLKGGQRSLGGFRQRLMEHGLRGAYERQNTN